MTTIVTRTETQTDGTAAKGSELTWSEVDTNFINLNDDKVEVSGAIVFAAKAGEALTKGDVVYVSGVSGNEPVVSKADADDASKMPAFGLAEDDANLNAAVNVVTFGTLYDLDTSAFSAGDTVYVSTTAGGLTTTKPAGESSLIQNLGLVIRSHASAGSIKVGGAGRTNAVPNLNDGNVFIGNASNQAETRALVEADISDLGAYIGLTDLSVTTNAAGTAALSYNNTTGVFSYTPPDLSSYLTSFTETNDLTAAVTWANVPNANITQSSVTQHQAALSITESQISDLGTYLTDVVSDTTPQLGGDLDVNGYAIKTAATGDLVLQAADVLQAKYNNGGSTALYANSISGKIAIGSATVGSATITLDGSTTVTGAFTSTGIDDNATSTAITIDSSQNVGIGTASPANLVDIVSSATTPTLRVQSTNGSATNPKIILDGLNDATIEMQSGALNGLKIARDGGAELLFKNNASEIDVTGKFTSFTSTGIDDNATSTAITIDSSQRVGVGVTSPGRGFEAAAWSGQQIIAHFETTSTSASRIGFSDANTTSDAHVGIGSVGNEMALYTGGSEKVRLNASGTLCVGDETPSANGPSSRLYVCSEDNNTGVSDNTNIPDIFVGSSSTAGGVGAGGEIRFGSRLYGTSGFAAFKGYIADGTANYNLGYLDLNMRATNSSASFTRRFRWEYDGDFHADGDVIAYSTTVSDERLKDDVETIDSALDKVSNLRGVTYTWNAGSREGKRDLGVIAQEVEAVIPEIVYEKNMALLDGETYKTVDYEKLAAVLIEAVKELKSEVEALKNGASV